MFRYKLAKTIVKARYVLTAAILAAAVLCCLMISRTRINYDLNRYLSDDTMTKRALIVMEDEFGSAEQLRILFADQTEEALAGYISVLNDQPEVLLAIYDPETGVLEEDGKTYQLVTVTLEECDAAATVPKLRSLFPEAGEYWVGGSAATLLDIQKSVGEEIPLVMIIAVAVVLGMLLVTSHAWMEPAVVLTVLAVSILINMGTNFVFADVSFVTFAVCAILQLALSIDYAIMLLHTYNGHRDAGKSAADAMTDALAECFMRIASSAMTTAAGLLSLLFMSFTIGFDIGMVLSKGIVISMLCVFLLMPGLTILLEKPLQKTRHKPVKLGGDKLAGWICRARVPLAIILVAAVAFGLFLNTRNTFTFTGPEPTEKGDSAFINKRFGTSTPLVLLVPGGETDEDYDRQRTLTEKLQNVKRADGSPAVAEVAAMVTTGAEALKYYTPAEVAELAGLNETVVNLFFMTMGYGDSVRADRLLQDAGMLAAGNETVTALQEQLSAAKRLFIGPNYARILAEVSFGTGDADFHECMDGILAACNEVYGDDYYVTGIHMSNYDISEAFHGDLLTVYMFILLAILLIVTVSFRAIRLPALLVLVIEGAIWITMGMSVLFGQSIFFISYLICLSIQMGATIDYGILLSDQYRTLRRAGKGAKEALQESMKKALPTVLTSGIILTVAGFIVGKVSSISYISSIGLLVSRGAMVSVILVLTLLPALLLSDKLSGIKS